MNVIKEANKLTSDRDLAREIAGLAFRARTEAQEERDALIKIIREMLVQIDVGPRDCYSTRRDGTEVWKGSFLSHVERLRVIMNHHRDE